MTKNTLNGMTIGAFTESGNVEELQDSVKNLGGKVEVFSWTANRESDQPIRDFANRLATGEVDMVVVATGAGARKLIAIAETTLPTQRFVDALTDVPVIAASKPAATVLAELEISPVVTVPEYGTWRDVLTQMDRHCNLVNQVVALEESADVYSLAAGLEARGCRVVRLPVFSSSELANGNEFDDFATRVEAHRCKAMLFLAPEDVGHFCKLAARTRKPGWTRNSMRYQAIVARDSDTAEVLNNHKLPVDLTLDGELLLDAISNSVSKIESIASEKEKSRISFSGPGAASLDENAPWFNSPFMKACRGEKTSVTPIWMMRQAGRYMAEYRAVREKVSFLDLCANPQLCSEVMCTAVNRLGVDAAIIFSDLLPILVPMGMDLEFVKGDGPKIHNPIRETSDIDRVKPLDSNDELQFVMDTVTQTRNDLPADMPLIGFAGAPFTLASYMIEGGSSRNYHNTKRLMYSDPSAWAQLMDHLVRSITIYLRGQVNAGAQCLQLFDSWAGCLSFEDYRHFVLPHVQKIISSIQPGVPVINFATGNPALLPHLADTAASVIGIDWRTRLDDAWQTVGLGRSVQGNLDPTVLLTNPAEIKRQAKIVLDQGADRPGHIFNLGHGILPMTPVENAIALVDAVHELSSK